MLFDLDKGGADRSQPKPNIHDTLINEALMAKGTSSVNYVTDATSRSLIDKGISGQFTIVQIGDLQPRAINDSSPDSLTYVKGSFLHQQVAHGLSFTPIVYSYYLPRGATTNSMMPDLFMQVGNDDGTNNPDPNGGWFSWYVAVDSTYVYLYTDYLILNFTVFGTPNGVYRYYLMRQVSS
jgi:hypothetical protein